MEQQSDRQLRKNCQNFHFLSLKFHNQFPHHILELYNSLDMHHLLLVPLCQWRGDFQNNPILQRFDKLENLSNCCSQWLSLILSNTSWGIWRNWQNSQVFPDNCKMVISDNCPDRCALLLEVWRNIFSLSMIPICKL